MKTLLVFLLVVSLQAQLATSLRIIVSETPQEFSKEACSYDDTSFNMNFTVRYESCVSYYNANQVMITFMVFDVVEKHTLKIDRDGVITSRILVSKTALNGGNFRQ